MRITSLIDDISRKGLPAEHGLSLYIEKDDGQRVLFDMGQGALFARNAEALGLDIAEVDVAVVSHGHYDHGGGLGTFLARNKSAKVFISKDAFLPHYSLRDTGLAYIGLDNTVEGNKRLVFCTDVVSVGGGMTLFANVQGCCCLPIGNRLLSGPSRHEKDSFGHEQNLIVEEADKVVVFAGCAHRGIVNILHRAEGLVGRAPTHVVAGMHLVKSGLGKSEEDASIRTLATELLRYDHTMFYTMHCTGEEPFGKLRSLMGARIEYVACGDSITI